MILIVPVQLLLELAFANLQAFCLRSSYCYPILTDVLPLTIPNRNIAFLYHSQACLRCFELFLSHIISAILSLHRKSLNKSHLTDLKFCTFFKPQLTSSLFFATLELSDKFGLVL